jgi:hypothetical protein
MSSKGKKSIPKKYQLSKHRLARHADHVEENRLLRQRSGILSGSGIFSFVQNLVEEAAPVAEAASDVFSGISGIVNNLANTITDMRDEIKGGQKLLDEEEAKLLRLTEDAPADSVVDFEAIEARRDSLVDPPAEEQQNEEQLEEEEPQHAVIHMELQPEQQSGAQPVEIKLPEKMQRGKVMMAEIHLSPRLCTPPPEPVTIVDEMPVVNKPARVVVPPGQKEVLQKALKQRKELSDGQKRTMEKLKKLKEASK